MIVVLDEAVEQRLFLLAKGSSTSAPGPLLELPAWLREEEGVATVALEDQGPPPGPGLSIPCSGACLPAGQVPARPAGSGVPAGSGLVLLAATGDGQGPVRAFWFAPGSPQAEECQVEVVRLTADVFSRLKGVFDTSILAARVVCVIGLGSGGGTGALELAKAGVGNFILVDFDRLRAHNISRHVCGLPDVGRFKTRAVRDLILQHNPWASVRCYESDVTRDDDLLRQVVSASDLVFVATDSELSRYLINEACLAAGKPAVYGGVYERAFAGEVVRVIPGVAGCYACLRQGLANTVRSTSTQQVFDYTEDTEFQAEPGLGLDVAFIAMLHAKVALMTLLRGTGSAVGDIDAEMVLWTNAARPQDGELFQQPMTRYFVRVPRSDSCPSCGPDSQVPPAA